MSQPDEGRLLNKRYQLLERFGSGGMALIYRGRDTLLGRYVAIKILRDDQAHGADFDRQFQNEARAAANLSHPNIVTVYDYGLEQGRLNVQGLGKIPETVYGKAEPRTVISPRE